MRIQADAGRPSLRVSVVIATCGRPALLARCLAALRRQDLDEGSFEIVVVDDLPGGCERTHVAIKRHTGAIRYVPNPGPHGPAAARNRGWHAARAPIVAFTDDDTVPAPDWLRAGLAALAPTLAAVSGRIVVPLPPEPTDYERDAAGLSRAEFATANCFCRKAVLEVVGGFDERFRLAWREDSDLQFRILAAGGRIGHAPTAVVEHPVRPAGWGVSLRQQRKAMYEALLYRNHPRRYRERIRAHPRWDYYATVASLVAGLAFAIAGAFAMALACFALWGLLTARFALQRLRGTARTPSHRLEMIVTSALIPPLALFWRLVGMLKFRAAVP